MKCSFRPAVAAAVRACSACALIVLASCAGAPARYTGIPANDTVSQSLRRETFDAVWNRINDTFWDPALLAERDWNGVRERYLPRAMATSNRTEFHKILNDMTKELRLSHFAVLGPEAIRDAWDRPDSARADAGMSVQVLDSVFVVTRLNPAGGAARAGIRTGFIIDSIDGVLPTRTPSIQLEGRLASKVRLAYRDAAGVRRTVDVVRTKRLGDFHRIKLYGIAVPGIPAQYAEVESKRLAGNAGYIRFSMFLEPIRGEVIRAIRSMSDARGIIIDLRGNPGGQDGMGRRIAGLLVDAKAQFAITRKRDEREVFYVEPAAPIYKGVIVILVDATSASASEQFAAGLQELERATIIGEKTAGRDLDATLKKLPSGGMLQYAYGEVTTPKGITIEGRGVTPNRVVPLSRKQLLEGVDTQLEAALAAIRGSTGSNR